MHCRTRHTSPQFTSQAAPSSAAPHPPAPSLQELSRSPLPEVRNNILVALADMCIHFTALVDTHVPRLAAAIRDPHELVRRQALALLANLMAKDYVKWRGTLFHRCAGWPGEVWTHQHAVQELRQAAVHDVARHGYCCCWLLRVHASPLPQCLPPAIALL